MTLPAPETTQSAWYSPTQVMRMRSKHVKWLAAHYELIREGKWPTTDCLSTGNSSSYRSPFEWCAMVLAVFHARIDKCGMDGAIYKADIENYCLTPMSTSALDRVRGAVEGYITGTMEVSYEQYKKGGE